MTAGKLDAWDLLHRVFPYTGCKRPDVILRAAIGEDCAALDFGDWCCVFSSDPITGAVQDSGWLAVHVSCNDLASSGAEPMGVMLTVLMPEGTGAEDVQEIMKSADRAARELGLEIMGGHTEFTAGIQQPILCATAVGKVRKDNLISTAGAKPGDDLVLTKGAGIEGTAILATDYEDFFRGKVPGELLAKAQSLMQSISVVPEGLLAADFKVSAMHDVTEGGVLGAIYEMAEASGLGVEVYQEQIPILPETHALCEVLGIDPLKLVSSGAMLIATSRGPELVALLEQKGIPAAVIGKVVEKERKVLFNKDETKEIEKPDSDELWRAKKIIEG